MAVFSQEIDVIADTTGATFPFTESVSSGSIINKGTVNVEIYLHQNAVVVGKAIVLEPSQIWDIDKPLRQFFYRTLVALSTAPLGGLGEGA